MIQEKEIYINMLLLKNQKENTSFFQKHNNNNFEDNTKSSSRINFKSPQKFDLSFDNKISPIKEYKPNEIFKEKSSQNYYKILRKSAEILKIDNFDEFPKKINTINIEFKLYSKFFNCLKHAIKDCSEKMNHEVTLKEAWKWIKNLIQNFMTIKKKNKLQEINLQNIFSLLGINSFEESIKKIENMKKQQNRFMKFVETFKYEKN